MPLDYHTIKNWPFEVTTRSYTIEDVVRYARGFGAGLPGALQGDDGKFLDPMNAQALPMVAVALADGEFWQSAPAAGLQWRQIVHAEEAITVHRPLPVRGTVAVERRIVEVYDRGVERGAMVHEQQTLRAESDAPLVTIDVKTVLRGDGGFGGQPDARVPSSIPTDRAPDAEIDLRTPPLDERTFQLSSEFDVAAGVAGAQPGQRMLRGVCCFGLAGRAVLKMVCGNDPTRLRRLVVGYAGPMLTDETVRAQLWHTGPGTAAFRLRALERDALVLNRCSVQLEP